MPSVKGKGGSASQRYQPASEYDDATLARRREYWRTQKRQQRARLSGNGKRPTRESTVKVWHLSAPAGVNCTSSRSQRSKSTESTATMLTNGRSANITAQRRSQQKTHFALRSRKPSHPGVPSSWDSAPVKTEDTAPQTGSNNADSLPLLQSEEERAALRREHWRIKKREQRAKMAAKLAKARERTQNRNVTSGRTSAAHPLGKVKTQIVINNHNRNKASQMGIPDGNLERKPPHFVLSSVPRAITRCRTPRQRLIDAQRHLKVKSLSLASTFNLRHILRIDSCDTPEQIIAKQREYWRIKKREQRAKMTMEAKARLKEKDSVMRRVRRYQKILEDMRRSRALAQSSGSSLSHVSETIGGFIKEDGTVSVNIPQLVSLNPNRSKSAEGLHASNPVDAKWRPLCVKQLPPQVNVSPVRAATQSTTTSAIQSATSTLTLTHPQRQQNLIPGNPSPGGCVMRMAVSNRALTLDLSLTEEAKMAKKREYWRVKKRQQRAARAARLRQSVSEARHTATLQRRKALRQAAATPVAPSRPPAERSGNQAPHLNDNQPAAPYANAIKQEPTPAANLNDAPQAAICPDLKPPACPASPAPSPPVPEPDLAVAADSQATTLLAVASMKRLLEESLSTVNSECKSKEAQVKAEIKEEASEPNLTPVAPIVADFTLQVKTQPPLKDDQTAPLSTSDMVLLQPTCKGSPQSTPMVRREGTPRLRPSRAVSHQNSSSTQPPKLHHHPERTRENRNDAGCRKTLDGVEQSAMSSLQRKREYWKLMKRQQRARLKDQLKDRRLPLRSNQAPALVANSIKAVKAPAKLLPKATMPSFSSGSKIPTLLVLTSSSCSAEPSTNSIKVKHPVTSKPCDVNEPHATPASLKWTSRSTDFLPTLKPPDNPLSTINLHPIEPPGQTPNPTLCSIKITQTSKHFQAVAPLSTMGPPKPVPGESKEDFQKRKREYWRIKKKEQRARKAVGDKGIAQSRVSKCKPILHAQDMHIQDSCQWVTSSPLTEESEHLISNSMHTEAYPDYTVPLQDELLFANDEHHPGSEDGLISEPAWRNIYLMDYDPLNQLLVCMVCGNLQYSHSLEGVRAHIDEAHPHTLTLEPAERRCILEAWDEQVSQRERFFTSQLQQHGATLPETYRE
ncbi:uncharacterized protein LOC129168423 isoform X2 [Dunckerocampus dactyliophorus]|uniref:uncharacterized protein LOC129168423 isoform X2 n=1 Tax=Dunckerocampus dactyliophorus TaxID=161453 RepID=UPI002405EF9A|nr:uncharacterized protein LOC129168423 isoform X2 [Dunckerocampus dactyliophorus]